MLRGGGTVSLCEGDALLGDVTAKLGRVPWCTGAAGLGDVE